MLSFITSRANIELFDRLTEKEDITPLEVSLTDSECILKIKKTDFAYRLIKKSKVFACNTFFYQKDKEQVICESNEGEFIDKFKLCGFERIDCKAIDCSAIKKAEVMECTVTEEKEEKDYAVIKGKILTTYKA